MDTRIALAILLVLAVSGCIGGEEAETPVTVKIDSYAQDGSVDEEGAATVRFKLSLEEGSGTTYVALFVPTAFNVEGNIRDKSYEKMGYFEIDEDRYELYMVENDAFEYANTPAQEYIVKINVDANQLASKDRRNTVLRVYWKDAECAKTVDGFDLSCYVQLDESKKSVTVGK